ncbi:MAG: hypothetical protein ABR84_03385 [Cryomorphaceae bacterium BACL21 MAG-121220-bin10]|jgi:hypothetical protein|nr:MAG: hypothetical protein ABR84_03385 [Cryomorphaceae bacterium BACL21 MAG-121220-bin10]|tara:strand:- start:11501 stop:11794 length:294 start_codon:yes stop_codon:yes gene_type:complete
MIKFTLIKRLKTNNRFNYTPRYYQGKPDMDHTKPTTKMDHYVDVLNQNDFAGHWQQARTKHRNRGNSSWNKTVVILIALFTFFALWIIDFDLSIFYR